MMGTHDEDTRRFFEGTDVNCVLVSRGRSDGVIADVFAGMYCAHAYTLHFFKF